MSSATVADLVADPRVVLRVLDLCAAGVAVVWRQSPNAHLSGATPRDVLRVRGADEVLDALDATLAGADLGGGRGRRHYRRRQTPARSASCCVALRVRADQRVGCAQQGLVGPTQPGLDDGRPHVVQDE